MTIVFRIDKYELSEEQKQQEITLEERAGMIKRQFVNKEGVMVTVYEPAPNTPTPKNYKWTKKKR